MKPEDFKEQEISLEDDYEGWAIATLIHSPQNEPGRPSVLYIHGYNDYFFQTHVAEAFNSEGYNFYALDLRKYGRSLLPHQHPNYCKDLREYFEEINLSLGIIQEQNSGNDIILLGHSTGGLIASLYLNEGKERHLVNKLLLNSPFLEFNASPLERNLMIILSRIISFFFPFASKDKPLSHLYSKSLLHTEKGEWRFNEKWKPEEGFPAYLKWIVAICEAQKKIQNDSDIKVPILVMHSSDSSKFNAWHEDITRTDMVLNVEHMKEYGAKLGEQVSFLEVRDAIHDIFLSQEEVRKRALNAVFEWLEKS